MKRLLLSILVALQVILASTVPVLAVTGNDLFPDCTGKAADSSVCKDSKVTTNPIYGPDGVLTTVADIIAAIVGVAAVIVIIVAGINYMMSQGDSSKVQTAKNAIIYAVIGLIVVSLARALVGFVATKVG